VLKDIIRKIRLISNSKKEPYLLFHNILGFFPDDITNYQLAVRHKSVPIKLNGRELSNERLEFLGDSILNLVITDIIYKRFQDESEGFLTNLRSKIVNRESLNQIAKELELDKIVVASKYVNQNTNDNIYGNALEALFGAIYLDLGYQKCKFFVEERLFRYFLDWNDILESETNFKSKLFEWCHKNHLEPEFILLEETVVKNKHTFHTCLKIQNQPICQATGNSKKESQQNVSKIACKKISEQPNFIEKFANQEISEKTGENDV